MTNERKRINSITEIVNVKKGRWPKLKKKRISRVKCLIPNKDFSNLDLSGIDLSCLDPEFWNGATFYNSNFSNTGIRFYPSEIKGFCRCEFENVDFSWLDPDEFAEINFYKSNLRNTNLDIPLGEKNIEGTKLDVLYADKPEKYWDRYQMDYYTLLFNPFLKVSITHLWYIIVKSVPERYFFTESEIEEIVAKCEELLKLDRYGVITKFYKAVCDASDDTFVRYNFFKGIVKEINLGSITIEEKDLNFLTNLNFESCTFKEMVCKLPFEILTSSGNYCDIFHSMDTVEKIVFADAKYHSWTELKGKRVAQITFKTNLYLELGKQCNCECSFCRNCSFKENGDTSNCYNFEAIKENVKKLFKYVDNIFIGGGEPTLRWETIKEIIELREDYYYRNSRNRVNIIVVTNGSITTKMIDELTELLNSDDSIYVSRHATSEEENLKILNPKKNVGILTLLEMREHPNYIVLSPVCVKGGLDSAEKIMEYISESLKYGIRSVIFSSLQKDASLGETELDYQELYVEPSVFEPVKKALLQQGYKKKPQIYSTGGYVLNIFSKSKSKIVFKEYLSKEEEEIQKTKSYKWTFDLTMTPNGDVYEDWRQEHKVDLSKI